MIAASGVSSPPQYCIGLSTSSATQRQILFRAAMEYPIWLLKTMAMRKFLGA